MFNVSSKPGKVIDFVSNPELPAENYLVPVQDETGNFRDEISTRPCSNRSPLEGCHFNEASDSLRARLNLGVPIREVPPLDVKSDPLELYNKARHFVERTLVNYDILSKEINDVAALAEPTSVESSTPV